MFQSWQKVDPNIAQFTPDITPLTLAAHRNNYEIIKILLDRGATLPMPHDIKSVLANALCISADKHCSSGLRFGNYKRTYLIFKTERL